MLRLPITTDRLVLRAPRADDLGPLREFYEDPVAVRHVGAAVAWTDEWIRAWHGRVVAGLADHGYTAYTVETGHDGAVVGFCGLMPNASGVPELCSGFVRRCWRKHYFREAFEAVVGHAQRDPDLTAIAACWEVDNPARHYFESFLVSRGFAFVRAAPFRPEGPPMHHYAWTAPPPWPGGIL
ncbi:GNAT family N-acetyltransferase [Spirillospora sp. NPDC049652]